MPRSPSKNAPFFLSRDHLIVIQTRVITGSTAPEDRGFQGLVRDEGVLDHIVSPWNQHQDPIRYAATLLYQVAVYHPFFQGNKRTAYAAAGMVLGLAGYQIPAPEPAQIAFVLAVASGKKSPESVVRWLTKNVRR